MKKLILHILVVVSICICAGCIYVATQAQPETTTQAYSVTVEGYNLLVDKYNNISDDYNTLLYMDRPTEIEIVETAPIVETINTARCFETRAELIEWLALDDTDKHEYIKYYYNCQHFSRDLQRAALDDGYLINVELTDDHTHMLNTVYILTNYCMYYIEPHTDQVW